MESRRSHEMLGSHQLQVLLDLGLSGFIFGDIGQPDTVGLQAYDGFELAAQLSDPGGVAMVNCIS